MSPLEALEILTQVTGQLQGTRQQHQKIQEALDAFAKLIPSKSVE